MKCRACDAILTDQEATEKDEYDEFLDLCFKCLNQSVNPTDKWGYTSIEEEDATTSC